MTIPRPNSTAIDNKFDISAVVIRRRYEIKDRIFDATDLIPINQLGMDQDNRLYLKDEEGEEDISSKVVEILEFVTKETVDQITERTERFHRADEVKARRAERANQHKADAPMGFYETPRSEPVPAEDIEMTIYDIMAAHPARISRMLNKPGEEPAQALGGPSTWAQFQNPEEGTILQEGVSLSEEAQQLQQQLEEGFTTHGD